MEALECCNDQILALAVFELAAGEDREATGKFARSHAGCEQAEIDALRTVHDPAVAVPPQDLLVPARPGHDECEPLGGREIRGRNRGRFKNTTPTSGFPSSRARLFREVEPIPQGMEDGKGN